MMWPFLSKYSYYLLSIFRLFLGFENPGLLLRIFLAPGAEEIRTVCLRGSGLRFKVRGAMDVWSIKETFLDRFYERFGFAVQPRWTIVDIGGGVGDYTLYAAAAQPSAQIYSFEPFPQSFALLQENLRSNAVANVQAFDRAISGSSGQLVLDLTGGEPLKFQSHAAETANIEKRLVVAALSLADAFAMLNTGTCDLLKLDCEGAEYGILFNAPGSALERVQRIVMEYHDHVVHHNHHDLARFLTEQGFQVETFPNPVHSYIGYLRAVRKN